MKQTIKMNESELHSLISESVKRCLNELDTSTINNAMLKSGYITGDGNSSYKKQLFDNIDNVIEFFRELYDTSNNERAYDYYMELDEMKKFIERKYDQYVNFEEEFADRWNNMSQDEREQSDFPTNYSRPFHITGKFSGHREPDDRL